MLCTCAIYVEFIKSISEYEIEFYLGGFMLSFELSAIDLILVIAVIVLLILYITKPSTKTATEKKSMTTKSSLKTEGDVQSPTPPPKNSAECPHHFGYLKKLGKNAAIPDECLSCSRMMKCLYSTE